VEASKNMVNDILLLGRKAQIIRTAKGPSLAAAAVKLHLKSDKMVREAVIQCDAAYLQAIQSLELPFDLQEAALALYESTDQAAYLQVVLQKVVQGTVDQA
jgi:hypothetical protein